MWEGDIGEQSIRPCNQLCCALPSSETINQSINIYQSINNLSINQPSPPSSKTINQSINIYQSSKQESNQASPPSCETINQSTFINQSSKKSINSALPVLKQSINQATFINQSSKKARKEESKSSQLWNNQSNNQTVNESIRSSQFFPVLKQLIILSNKQRINYGSIGSRGECF